MDRWMDRVGNQELHFGQHKLEISMRYPNGDAE